LAQLLQILGIKGDTQPHREQDDLKILFSYFQNKKIGKKILIYSTFGDVGTITI
jgi:hypothetical protein